MSSLPLLSMSHSETLETQLSVFKRTQWQCIDTAEKEYWIKKNIYSESLRIEKSIPLCSKKRLSPFMSKYAKLNVVLEKQNTNHCPYAVSYLLL